jgi:acyl carrier protein
VSETIEQRTCRVVADVFGLPIEQVTRATSHENVEGWDSLNVLNILMAVEGEFGVGISPEEAAEFVSVEKIVAVVESKRGA